MRTRRQTLRRGALALLVGAAGAASMLAAPVAQAATTVATVSVTGGTLAFCSVSTAAAFPSVALTGQAATVSVTTAIDVCNGTGPASGWNVTATSTLFSASGGVTLPATSTTVDTQPPDACDAGSSCTLASDTVSYPYTLPAGATAPTATKLFAAAAGSGGGDQTITPTWTVLVPADAATGSYSSTWTLSLASGP